MNTYYYTLFLLFVIIATMMILDNNIGVYLTLVFRLIRINTTKLFWMIRLHPNNFITTWIQNQKYDKIAKDLEKQLKNEVGHSED